MMKDGPYVVEGDFTIFDSEGNELKKMAITSFCRCGQSNSMPFCDGTHRKISFSDQCD
ncbi:MAG: CDGSH iron-sulfur domain-containing protein [Bacteroidales bacterium]|nr:CDGSH iron-sulfur domain-containing protein [Bacteroidales bacterium]